MRLLPLSSISHRLDHRLYTLQLLRPAKPVNNMDGRTVLLPSLVRPLAPALPPRATHAFQPRSVLDQQRQILRFPARSARVSVLKSSMHLAFLLQLQLVLPHNLFTDSRLFLWPLARHPTRVSDPRHPVALILLHLLLNVQLLPMLSLLQG